MKIVVLVKDVPDTYGERHLSLETGLTDREGGERVPDEIGTRALEAALAYADGVEGTEVTVLTLGPEGATASIRKCLAMGAASATHIVDASLVGADLGLTAEALAAAIRRSGFDLVLAGNQSTDGAGGVLPAMLAELLEVPVLGNLARLEITAEEVAGTRLSDDATLEVSATLPAVVSVTEALPDPRFPNFKGIMAAKKKPLETVTLAELGVEVGETSTPRVVMTEVAARPARSAGEKIVAEPGAEGEAAAALADFLVANRLA